jgi:FtsP/CotA-like multicopper oxidase with cupredoxin domain
MAIIPRDLDSSLDPNDPVLHAEYEGFGPDVPNTRGIITAVNAGEVNTAQIVRAQKLFTPAFLSTLQADGDFPTPDPVVPDVILGRQGRTQPVDIFAPGDINAQNRIRIWSFDDTQNSELAIWPAPTIRVREGQIVHTLMSNSHGPHTVHHHGIEPTGANDGVGHLSMEVGGNGINGNYFYQWKAAEAGTYFYHCHRNTTLHFERGMYGMLIVDPDVLGAPFADGQAGQTLVGDTPTPYDRETFWVADDIDLSWHESDFLAGLDKDFGIQDPTPFGGDINAAFKLIPTGGLNDFNPDFFVVTGVTIGLNGLPEQPTAAQIDKNGALATLYSLIQPTLTSGQTLLVRTLNASYCTTVWRFPTSIDGTITAIDGRTLGRSGFGDYSQPFRLSELPLVGGYRQFTLTTAHRWDVLVDTVPTDGAEVLVEFRHWLDYDSILQTARLPIAIAS